MLFNSYIFVFAFLPVTLAGFYWLGRRRGRRPAIGWLVGADDLKSFGRPYARAART